MPRGKLTKVEMEAKIYKLYNQLENEDGLQEQKGLAKGYLWKVMDFVKEYSN
jgi:hypothetical protein